MSVLAATIEKYTLHPAPGFDNLALARILGWQSLVRKSDFPASEGYCLFIPPEMSVDPTRPEWAFLEKRKFKIRAVKMKGIISEGLALPVPPALIGVPPGTDVSSVVGAFRTPEPYQGADLAGKKARYHPGLPDYPDFGRLQLTPDLFREGELVTVREKLHGTQARYTWCNGELLIASHHTFRSPDSPCVYAQVARDLDLASWLPDAEPVILYGEIVGPGIQKGFDYGFEKPTLVLFDIYDKSRNMFFGPEDFPDIAPLFLCPRVPQTRIHFSHEAVRALAESPSEFHPGTLREGIVIHAGYAGCARRRSAKLINTAYLSRND